MISSNPIQATKQEVPSSNRARHALVAITMQLLVSVTYSYSVFRTPLATLHGWSKAQTIAPYQYMVLMVSFGAILGGAWQDRQGARTVATFGGCLIGLGCLLSAYSGESNLALIAAFGIIAGIGVGLAYVTPIANLVKWFPDKRGMIVGFAVMGSGFSAFFWAPLIERLIGKDPALFHLTVPRTFLIMAALFVLAVGGLAQFYREPPPGWKPAGWAPLPGLQILRSYSSSEMLRTWQFYALYLGLFLGSSVGLTAIGQVAPLLQETGRGGSLVSTGVAVGIVGLFNAFGRLAWGTLSDVIGRNWTLMGMSLVSIGACVGFLRAPGGFAMALAGLCLAAFAYAGFLALMPAFTADYFGTENVGGNYGILFTSWGVCGFVVPGYFERLLDGARESGGVAAGYREVYFELALLAALVFIVAAVLRPPGERAPA